MSHERIEELKPFISILIVIGCLLGLVFFKMEARRVGYSVLKLAREERRIRDLSRQQTILLAKITRPDRLQNVAQNRLTLKRAESGQIIQITDQGVALQQ